MTSQRMKRIMDFVNSTYGEDTGGTWGVYRNKKTGEMFISKRRPCRCNFDALAQGMTYEQASEFIKNESV